MSSVYINFFIEIRGYAHTLFPEKNRTHIAQKALCVHFCYKYLYKTVLILLIV